MAWSENTARPAAHSLWTEVELAALRADPVGFRSATRSPESVAAKRRQLGVKLPRQPGSSPPRPFTPAELRKLRAGARAFELPGRSPDAVRHKRHKMGLARSAAPNWTAEELAALREDPYRASLPGRSKGAIKRQRYLQGLTAKCSRWDEESRSLLRARYGTLDRAGWHAVLPNRSHRAIRAMAHYLQVTRDRQRRRAWSTPQNVMATVTQAIPAGLPANVRDEVLQMVMLDVLEGAGDGSDLAALVGRALKRQYKLYPQLGGPISLDAPTFVDGPPLIERITESVWV